MFALSFRQNVPKREYIMNAEKFFTKKYVVIIAALLCCFLWGSAFPCIKIGYSLFNIEGTGSKILFAGLRFILAGILVIISGSIIKRKFLYPKVASLKYVGALSLTQTAVQYLLFYIGLSNCSGVKSSVVEATNVFLAILVACFIFRLEKFTVIKLIGCIVGFAGIVIVNFNGLDFNLSFTGEGFIFLSALSSAFSASMIKIFSSEEDTVTLSGYQFLLGGIILTVVGLISDGRITAFTVNGALILLYLAFISAAAYTLWGLLLKYNRPSLVSAFGFFNPVFGVVLSAWWLGESADWVFLIIALVLVSAGTVIISLLGDKKRSKGLT